MPSKVPRCPNGSRRKPPKTGKCVKNSVKKDVKKQKKTQKNFCPSGKILNPKTNRCINDNSANRKRLKLSDAKPKNGVFKISIQFIVKNMVISEIWI